MIGAAGSGIRLRSIRAASRLMDISLAPAQDAFGGASFESVLDAADIGTWRYRFADRLTWFSAGAQALYGHSSDLVVNDGDAVRRRVHPDDAESVMRALAAATDPDGSGRYASDHRVRRPEGGWRWISVRGQVIFEITDAGRQPSMMVGISQDVTERKRGEIFLDAQKQSLEMVVSGAPLSAVLSHLTQVVERLSDGQVVASIFFVDEEGRLRNGASPSLPAEYVSAIDGLKIRPDLGTCSAAAATRTIVVTPDIASDPKWATIKHLPLGLGLKAAWSHPITARDGRVLGTFGTYFRESRGPSAHERQAVEILTRTAALAIERVHAESKLREADRNKDEFLATLSHELRNPLAPLRTAVHLMQSTPDPAAVAPRLLGTMDRQVGQLVRLVDDLLEVSRINRGTLDLRQERVEVASIVKMAVETSVRLLESCGEVVCVEMSGEPLWVLGVASRLAQILANLLNNAAKYTPAGGRIQIEVRREGDSARVAIRDNGMGIEPGALSRLFGMFERGHDTAGRHPSGLGIGLSLARRLAEMHGGTLDATSEGVDQGSEFTLRLPIA
jgi:PAS domain S-box-containing protein